MGIYTTLSFKDEILFCFIFLIYFLQSLYTILRILRYKYITLNYDLRQNHVIYKFFYYLK